MNTGKLRARLSCSCCIEPELSIMNTMSRSLFTDSSNVGAVGIGLPLGSGIAASSSVRPHPAASAKKATSARRESDALITRWPLVIRLAD